MTINLEDYFPLADHWARIIRAKTWTGADVDDLAQLGRIAIWEQSKRWCHGDFGPAANVVARQAVTDELKVRKRSEAMYPLQEEPTGYFLRHLAPSAEACILAEELSDALLSALARLNPIQRRCLLGAADGFQPRELGQMWGMTGTEVSYHLDHARSRMKRILTQNRVSE